MHTLVMTGATGGIGAVAAAELLRRDPDLRLAVLARHPHEDDDRVRFLRADLASIADVRAGAATVRRMVDDGRLPPLAGIIGNAGVSLPDSLHTTPDGFETTFAVNVLANHLLVAELAPLLRPPARIVITVSDTHTGEFKYMPAPRWADPSVLARPGAFPRPDRTVAGRTAYTTSKLAAIHLVHEWARRLPAGVDIVAHNPGFVPMTGLSREAGAIARRLSRLLTLTPMAESVATAGRKLADVALGTTRTTTGAYVDRARVTPSSAESYDQDRERLLWKVLNELIGA